MKKINIQLTNNTNNLITRILDNRTNITSLSIKYSDSTITK